ncbi:MAG: phytanoyl-CoA dioxygenase family protein [Aestuariibacter sp.]
MENNIPSDSYGVLEHSQAKSSIEIQEERIRRIGYSVVSSGYDNDKVAQIRDKFEQLHQQYQRKFSAEYLAQIGEKNLLRAPLSMGGKLFIELACNPNVVNLVENLIPGKYLLNAQNGAVNEPNTIFSQGRWHRDLPYMHYTSSSPLAVNAIYCVDDFTLDNGATFVLPGSHKFVDFPSPDFVKNNALQVQAKAGDFIVLDSMVFHASGHNGSGQVRRAINHLYSLPVFKQQIDLSQIISPVKLSSKELQLLGFLESNILSVEQFLNNKWKQKQGKNSE